MTQGCLIVVKCPDCAEQRVSPQEVTVRQCLDDGAWSYRFTCPNCCRRTIGVSAMTSLRVAIDAGAEFEEWTLGVPSERPAGPPFMLADVLELHLLLLEPDWFDDLSRYELDAGR